MHLVELDGEIIPHGNPVDKVVAHRRKIVKTIDAAELCRAYSRRVALDVIHLWDAPGVVTRFLETGDESLRAAARFAAWDAAWDALRAAARDAARDAAWDAVRAAARDAARDAAWDAAWDAARAAKYSIYRQWFLDAVQEAFKSTTSENSSVPACINCCNPQRERV